MLIEYTVQLQMALNLHCTIFFMMFFRVVTTILGFEESDNRLGLSIFDTVAAFRMN